MGNSYLSLQSRALLMELHLTEKILRFISCILTSFCINKDRLPKRFLKQIIIALNGDCQGSLCKQTGLKLYSVTQPSNITVLIPQTIIFMLIKELLRYQPCVIWLSQLCVIDANSSVVIPSKGHLSHEAFSGYHTWIRCCPHLTMYSISLHFILL